MGIGADSTQKAYYAADIKGLLERTPVGIYRDFYEQNDRDNTNHILVAVDPSGGGASSFAVASVCQLPTGQIVVSGQFPNLSPGHISASTIHSSTNASGAWHECLRKRGATKGSTRSTMSAANRPPRMLSCSLK